MIYLIISRKELFEAQKQAVIDSNSLYQQPFDKPDETVRLFLKSFSDIYEEVSIQENTEDEKELKIKA